MGFFEASHKWRGGVGAKTSPFPKICHLYPTMMKLATVIPYLKQKKISMTWHTSWVQLTSPFFTRNEQNLLYQEMLLEFLNNFFFINMVTILMMSAKMTTPGLLKIKVFWNNGFEVIISVNDVIKKILSSDSNYSVDVVMWPKFGNSSISMKEVIITSIL